MYIPDAKIDELRAAADIVDVVGDYVRLKKSGSRFKGLCPFHDERTPSFSVDPRQNLFYCFGCQKGGDLFTFLQEIEGVSFTEAARMLAEQTGIPLPEREGGASEQAKGREAIYHTLRFAARYFYRQLTQTEAGRPALGYLTGRGFTPQTIKRFGLGYAPDAWDALLAAAEEAHVDAQALEKAGLVIARKRGEGHYDRYRGRVIFPLFSHVGKVLGFAGRILDDAADQPKYINSPETKVYHKSHVLYGLHQAKQAIRRAEEAILVEGYTDVMALHQAGAAHVVASSGTALTREQVKMLGRYAERLVLLYDADEAGANAALRAIDLILEEGLAPYALQLPSGQDPDTFVQQEGAEAFAAYLKEERQDFIAFRYAQARRAGLLDTPEGTARTMREAVASIARIDDPLAQETYLRRASEVLGVPDIRLHEAMGAMRRSQKKKQRRRAPRPQAPRPASPSDGQSSGGSRSEASAGASDDEPAARAAQPLPPERFLLRLMLTHGAPMVEFILGNMALSEFTEGPVRDVAHVLLGMYEERDVAPQRILGGSHGAAQQRLAASVMVDRYELSENWKRRRGITVPHPTEQPREAAVSAMTLLKLERVGQAIERVKQEQYRVGDDLDALRAVQQRLIDLQQLQRKIQRREFLNWNEN